MNPTPSNFAGTRLSSTLELSSGQPKESGWSMPDSTIVAVSILLAILMSSGLTGGWLHWRRARSPRSTMPRLARAIGCARQEVSLLRTLASRSGQEPAALLLSESAFDAAAEALLRDGKADKLRGTLRTVRARAFGAPEPDLAEGHARAVADVVALRSLHGTKAGRHPAVTTRPAHGPARQRQDDSRRTAGAGAARHRH